VFKVSCFSIISNKGGVINPIEFDNYYGWCRYVSNILLKSSMDKTIILPIIVKILDDIELIYHFERGVAMGYISKFFTNKRWLNYMRLTMSRREYYGAIFF